MKLSKHLTLLAAATASAACLCLPAMAGVTINVTLWDKGDMAMTMMEKMHDMGQGMGMGMGMMGGDMKMAPMGITADQSTVPAGEVTFAVTNSSSALIHEMVVTPVAEGVTSLPYIEEERRVDEDAAGHVGEVAELDTGAKGSLTVTLTPGTYILYCNVPGHYATGMWTTVTVTQ